MESARKLDFLGQACLQLLFFFFFVFYYCFLNISILELKHLQKRRNYSNHKQIYVYTDLS